MKKRLFYLFALICSVSLFTACSDDDNEGTNDNPVSPYVGTYRLADYETQDVAIPGEDKVKKNLPVGGALYFDWKLKEVDPFVENMIPLVRYMGSSLLPAALGAVTLDENGDLLADYIEKPNITLDMSSVMGLFLGLAEYPAKDQVTANFPTSGFVTSSKGLASWEESNGKFTLKLSIADILSAAAGGTDMSEIAGIIDKVLNESTPSEIKQLLGAFLGGADLSGIQDATILQLLGWVKDGIPMDLRVQDNGHVVICLNKSAFDNLFTPRDSGTTDDWGDPEKTSDIKILWDALVAANMIPQDAQAAGIMIETLSAYWSKTQTFDLGLELVKK